jgi:biotin carboxyl carrier protein
MGRAGRFVVRQDETSTAVEVMADGRVRVGAAPDPFTVTAAGEGHYLVSDGLRTWRVAVAGPPDARFVATEGLTARVDIEPEGAPPARKSRAGPGGTAAPMPGTVIEIAVEVGQHVSAGDVLITLEAMKMELPIRAPRDGLVSAIRCQAGELVQPGVALVDLS